MTKHVRIENADTANYGVAVEVWEKGTAFTSGDTLVFTEKLNFPTAMTTVAVYLTSTRYLVVKEIPAGS